MSNRLSPISPQHVPFTEQAITMYEACGGRLSRENSFREDPLRNDPPLVQERERTFRQRNLDLELIHGRLANGDPTSFETAVLSFIDITKTLAVRV